MHRSDKRGDLGFSQIITGIIVLVAVLGGGKIAYDLTDSGSKYLLGNANISAFDQDIVERYNETRQLNQGAADSVRGLLYALNSLAYLDTWRERAYTRSILGLSFRKQEDLTKVQRSFGGTTVEPTYADRQILFIPKTAAPSYVKNEISLGVLSCWFIFQDKGAVPTRCFELVMPPDYPQDKAKELDAFLDNGVAGYLRGHVQELCQLFSARYAHIPFDTCVSQIEDVSGKGFFGVSNIEQDDLPDDFFTQNAPKGETLKGCSTDSGLNEVHLHGGYEDVCDAPVNRLALGYTVRNFNLPQDVSRTSSVTANVVESLTAYGDPDYVLFYEKFPQEEAQYWEVSDYQIAWGTILLFEGGFAVLDAITLGLGSKAGKALTAPIRKSGLGVAAGAIKDAAGAVGRGAAGLVRKVFSRPLEWALKKQLAKEAVGESAERLLGNTIRNLLGETDDALAKEFRPWVDLAMEDFLETSGETLVRNGRITPEGERELLQKLTDIVFKSNREALDLLTTPAVLDPYEKLILRRAEQLAGGGALTEELVQQAEREVSQRVTQEAAQEIVNEAALSGLRKLPREAVRVYRAGTRGQNLLREILLGDMTEEARKEAIIKVLRDGESALLRMSALEQRAFLANQRKISQMLFREETGEVILGAIGEDFTQETAEQAFRRLDTIINSQTANELVPRAGRIIQAQSNRVLEPLAQKRHAVAVMAGIVASRIESMAEKSYPVGTNALGLKSPYLHTVVYGELPSAAEVDYTDINTYKYGTASDRSRVEKDIKKHQEFVEQRILPGFGEEGVEGTIPELGRYYLSLIKDQGFFSQDPQRFHLVSPCQTDIQVVVTSCTCWYDEDIEAGVFETGKRTELLGKDEDENLVPTGVFADTPHFDGQNSMLYTLDTDGNPVKQCHPDTSWFSKDELHKPLCITLNPLVENFGTTNYCYHGISDTDESLDYAITASQVGLPFLGLFCGPAAPACMAGIGFITGVLGEAAKGEIAVDSQWPNHD